MTCRLANTLKAHGVLKGDRVAVYLPTSPLAVAAMLACARIGAVHTVVFAGFSAEALAGRIQDGEDHNIPTAPFLPFDGSDLVKVAAVFPQHKLPPGSAEHDGSEGRWRIF